jgi:hypothetical protein
MSFWSVFSGACGHTYGHNDVYGFFSPAFPGQVLSLQTRPSGPGQRGEWREALQAPGATQMRPLRRLIESRPFLTQVPDQSLLATPETSPLGHLAALRGEVYALVYAPTGKPFRVWLDRLSDREVQAWWFDPRTGESQEAGRSAADTSWQPALIHGRWRARRVSHPIETKVFAPLGQTEVSSGQHMKHRK